MLYTGWVVRMEKKAQRVACRVYFRCDGECSGDIQPDRLLEKQLKDQMVGQKRDSFRGCGSDGCLFSLVCGSVIRYYD